MQDLFCLSDVIFIAYTNSIDGIFDDVLEEMWLNAINKAIASELELWNYLRVVGIDF